MHIHLEKNVIFLIAITITLSCQFPFTDVPCDNGGSCSHVTGSHVAGSHVTGSHVTGSHVTGSEPRFECLCDSGFFGERCEFHQPCKNFLCQNLGTCVQTEYGEVCHCSEGWTGM